MKDSLQCAHINKLNQLEIKDIQKKLSLLNMYKLLLVILPQQYYNTYLHDFYTVLL